jgi:hypothetical protein
MWGAIENATICKKLLCRPSSKLGKNNITTLSSTNPATPQGGSSECPKPNVRGAALVLTSDRPRGASPDCAERDQIQLEGGWPRLNYPISGDPQQRASPE